MKVVAETGRLILPHATGQQMSPTCKGRPCSFAHQKHHRHVASVVNTPPRMGPRPPASAHITSTRPRYKARRRIEKRSLTVILTSSA